MGAKGVGPGRSLVRTRVAAFRNPTSARKFAMPRWRNYYHPSGPIDVCIERIEEERNLPPPSLARPTCEAKFSRGRMSKQDVIVPDGWCIRTFTFHHDLAYWSMWALNFLSSFLPGVSPTPPAADVSYTLCRKVDGALRTIRLPGDHAPDALAKTMLLVEAVPRAQKS